MPVRQPKKAEAKQERRKTTTKNGLNIRAICRVFKFITVMTSFTNNFFSINLLILAFLTFAVTMKGCESLLFERRTAAVGIQKVSSSLPPPSYINFQRQNLVLSYGKSDQADGEKNPQKSTPIEDGSPLGVAIVVLGGSYVVFGEQDIPVWIVFVTASIAAGISRLIRYQNKR